MKKRKITTTYKILQHPMIRKALENFIPRPGIVSFANPKIMPLREQIGAQLINKIQRELKESNV